MLYYLIILNFALITSEIKEKLIFVMIHFGHGAHSIVILGNTDLIGEKMG